ncbi:MAG: SDR family NAD(P)-dependent oxidoreductase [Planctomycetota bacterium]|jgi:UDP-N-acetylglucosamine 4,6-dehydratase
MPEMTTLLITGGTGTFGRAFTAHALTNNLYDRIVILSRDEKKQQEMANEYNDPRLRFLLGDVKDLRRLETAFQGVDIVIHAAAYKQLPRSFLDWRQFKEVNIDGMANVCDAAHNEGVGRVIALSSDKACSSISPYGTTKSALEFEALSSNVRGSARITCLRYGNILDSRGSVLELWRQRVVLEQPPEITDERMSRFWMTIQDAVDLTLKALHYGRGGEIFIPASAPRKRVLDLFREYYPGQDYVIIKKRGYEKLAEELICAEESDRAVYCEAPDCFVLLPPVDYMRWEPLPYGTKEGEGIPVPLGFVLRSDG